MARVVFMGTPQFAIPSLRALLAEHELVAVLTQPDRPAGRRRQLRISPVKQLAAAEGLPIYQPERIRSEQSIAMLSQLEADVFVVVAYGQILPQSILDLPPHGCVNVHASLLPRWRGAAPIQAAIRAGDAETGLTIMKMDAGMDTGPILMQRAIPIAPRETGQSLHDKLAVVGADSLMETLPLYLRGAISQRDQDDARAAYAPAIKKEDSKIDWSQSAIEIDRLVRAYRPWPGTYTNWNRAKLKIHAGCAVEGQAPPGFVVQRQGAIAIGSGSGLYLPEELQLEGKRRVSIADFMHGHGEFLGAALG